jgi:2-polyprenyl-6-methoxyphenol hydroxylase-like FAD-dependent oxidoreductase
VRARYLVGCDGAHSRVRDGAGIPFPGATYPEVNRLGQVTLPDSVTRLDNGDLDVPGLGRIRAGFTRTDRGVFAFGSLTPEVLLVLTTEDKPTESDDDTPMTLTELQDSIPRVLGANLPLGKATRLSRYQLERGEELKGFSAHIWSADRPCHPRGPE